ncbi:MAG: ABC transporter permease [Sedimentisphaerales bacterium]|nr:ABC transporter permease [Sedimentisphaerales bacterium]
MSILINDIKFACRRLCKKPGFTAVAVLTLLLGIGVNTIMFSVVNALALRPVKVKEPERLVVCKSARDFGVFMPEVFKRIRAENPIFTDVMACSVHGDCALRLGNITRPGRQLFVSSNYFSVLGVTPDRGRDFLAIEETPGTNMVGVLSHRAWLRLGADPNAIGKFVYINGFPCHIVGITPEGFSGPTLLEETDVWLSLGSYANMLSGTQRQLIAKDPRMRDYFNYPHFLNLIGRLKSDLTLSTAQAHFRSMAGPLMELFPDFMQKRNKHWFLQPLPRFILSEPDSRFALPYVYALIIGAGLALLCITCLNLANMHIVQGEYRHREIAIRTAMGGSRMRIVQQLLIEALLLVLIGGALGLILAFWGMTLLNGSVARPAALQSIQFVLDANVLLAALISCLVATLLSGLWPSIHSSRHDIMSNLKKSQGGLSNLTTKGGRVRLSGLSVAGQIGLSVVLLIGATLFTRSALKAIFVTPGYSFDGKLVVDIDFRVEGNKQAERQQLCQQLVKHMQTLPEVRAAGFSTGIPFGDTLSEAIVNLMDAGSGTKLLNPADGISCTRQNVAGGYFQAVGLPLLQGRNFTLAECIDESKVAIVDEHLAFQLRPDGNVLGCLLKQFKTEGYREIVGIVPNVRHHVIKNEVESHVYHPLSDPQAVSLILRVAGPIVENEKNLLKRIRQEISSVNSHIAVTSVCKLSDRHRSGAEMWAARIFAGLFLFFGAAALFLAILGIYGVKGYTVAIRIPEFCIRRTLGATGVNIATLVLREGVGLMLIGLAIGLICALAVLHVFGNLILKHVLCDIEPIDPVSIVVALILVTLAVLLAGYIPARRAIKVDPMEVLRYE